jgi:hypothetical protein
MNFKEWVANNRIDNLLCQLIDCRVDLVGLAHDLSLVTEADEPKSLFARLRKRFGDAAKGAWQDQIDDFHPMVNFVKSHIGKSHTNSTTTSQVTPQATPETPEDRLERLYGQLQTHTARGYHDEDPAWKGQYDTTMNQIHSLGKESKPFITKSPVDDNSIRLQKAKTAVATLRDVLKDPKFEPILNKLEYEVQMMGKPEFYHNMTDGERSWYDKLNDTDRSKFDKEITSGGNQNINQGDTWWNVAAARAQKASQQGYQDADANWRWSAGFANRQRIRRNMNPEWEKELQGEALTPGGKMFREWMKRRVSEDATPPVTNAPTNVQSNVMAPTDPKEIAQRKAVNDLTSTMMKKNPRLKPGETDQQTVANLASSDPQLAKADPKTQQAVSAFFLKQQ